MKPLLLELGGKNALIAYARRRSGRGRRGRRRRHELHVVRPVVRLDQPRVRARVDLRGGARARARRASRAFRPGLPTDPATTMGAIVSRAQLERVEGYIASAHARRRAAAVRRQAARAIRRSRTATSSSRPCSATSRQAMRIAREEIFGPVLAILPWTDERRMIDDVNAVPLRPHLLDLDERPDDGAPHRRRRSRRATSGSTRSASISSARRSAACASPGSGARSASRSSCASRRRRTSTSSFAHAPHPSPLPAMRGEGIGV